MNWRLVFSQLFRVNPVGCSVLLPPRRGTVPGKLFHDVFIRHGPRPLSVPEGDLRPPCRAARVLPSKHSAGQRHLGG